MIDEIGIVLIIMIHVIVGCITIPIIRKAEKKWKQKILSS
jgi:hypothetical protein